MLRVCFDSSLQGSEFEINLSARGTASFTVEAKVWAEPSINWLTSNLEDIVAKLSQKFQNLLGQDEEAASHFPRVCSKRWNFKLPQAV